MATARPKLTAARRRSLADAFIHSYVSWREACEEVRSAYERWKRCRVPQRRVAFESYSAALDREELAARVHSDWTEQVRAAKHGELSTS
jgi:hypothetical protein